MELTREEIFCGECGAQRINMRTGSVCPNGHGKLGPKLHGASVRAFLRQEAIAQLPVARHPWILPGHTGEWRFRNFAQLKRPIPPGCILAVIDCDGDWLRPAFFERMESTGKAEK